MARFKTSVTLRDVALRAGCSTAVVSTVINNARGNTQVSEETRRRVLEASRALAYRPNFASRSLARGSTNTLGIYIPPAPWAGVGYPYEGQILRGIEAACSKAGYDLLVINLSGEQTPEACLEKLTERRIDGLILIHLGAVSDWVNNLVQAGANVVAVDYPNVHPKLNAMVFDNEVAGRLAAEYLCGLGHQRIGMISTCQIPINPDIVMREQAFIRTVKKLGREIRPEWIFNRERWPRSTSPIAADCQSEGRVGADYMMSLPANDRPTALFAYNDLTAIYAQMRFQVAGVRIPDDFSLMGVDDSEWARFMEPHLTTLRHPLMEMGQRAAELLITANKPAEEISTKVHRGVHELFVPELVIRNSTAALR